MKTCERNQDRPPDSKQTATKSHVILALDWTITFIGTCSYNSPSPYKTIQFQKLIHVKCIYRDLGHQYCILFKFHKYNSNNLRRLYQLILKKHLSESVTREWTNSSHELLLSDFQHLDSKRNYSLSNTSSQQFCKKAPERTNEREHR